jgi:glucan phosphoethanolaminetransferase (alkaline phosphatase superfamily)
VWIRAALIFALTLASACAREGASPPPAASTAPRNVLLVTIDTLRADHVGAYGYAAARTPILDRLAREGLRFEHVLIRSRPC